MGGYVWYGFRWLCKIIQEKSGSSTLKTEVLVFLRLLLVTSESPATFKDHVNTLLPALFQCVGDRYIYVCRTTRDAQDEVAVKMPKYPRSSFHSTERSDNRISWVTQLPHSVHVEHEQEDDEFGTKVIKAQQPKQLRDGCVRRCLMYQIEMQASWLCIELKWIFVI